MTVVSQKACFTSARAKVSLITSRPPLSAGPYDPGEGRDQKSYDIARARVIRAPRIEAPALALCGRMALEAVLIRPSTLRLIRRSVSSTSSERDEEQDARDRGRFLGRNWLASWKMKTGAVSVLPVRFPATITTAPNSPIARANARSAPAAMAGRSAGSTTRRNVVHPDAPNENAASSSAISSSLSTGCTVRIDERKRHEQQRHEDPERGERNLDAVVGEPSSDRRARPIESDEHHSGDERRDRERKVDDRAQ